MRLRLIFQFTNVQYCKCPRKILEQNGNIFDPHCLIPSIIVLLKTRYFALGDLNFEDIKILSILQNLIVPELLEETEVYHTIL